jgi:hypothetical protein
MVEYIRAPPPNYECHFKNYLTSTINHGGGPHLILHGNGNEYLQGWILGSQGLCMNACATPSRSCIKTHELSRTIPRTLGANLFCWARSCAMLSSVHFLRRTAFMNPSHSRQQMTHHMLHMIPWITQRRSELRIEAYSKTICGSRAGHGGIHTSTLSVWRETRNCTD